MLIIVTVYRYAVISYQLKLIKMRAELTNLNNCAVPILSRAAVNLCWYYYVSHIYISSTLVAEELKWELPWSEQS